MSSRRAGIAALVCVALAGASAIVQSFSWNQTSHYDLIRALDTARTTIDPTRQHRRQGPLPRPLVLGARAGPGAVRAALLRHAHSAQRAGGRARIAGAARRRRDDLLRSGLWGNVLPGLLLLLLVWRVAERFEPGYGAAAAVTLGLGTLVLPLSTLLFSHVFTALPRLRRVRADAARARRPAAPAAARPWPACDRLRDRLGVPAVLRGRRARRLPALAPRRAHRRLIARARRRLRRRRPGRDRAAAALQPRGLRLVDAPRLLRHAPQHRRASSGSGRPACEGAVHAAVRLARACSRSRRC